MTAPARFTQSDVTRAVKGALAGGVRLERAEIDINGKIVIVFARGGSSSPRKSGWDRVLDRDQA